MTEKPSRIGHIPGFSFLVSRPLTKKGVREQPIEAPMLDWQSSIAADLRVLGPIGEGTELSKSKSDSQTIALETVRASRSALTRGWKSENDAVREKAAPYEAAATTASKDYLLPAAHLLAHLLDQDRSKEANAK